MHTKTGCRLRAIQEIIILITYKEHLIDWETLSIVSMNEISISESNNITCVGDDQNTDT
jgi:hypothetical protein